MCVLPLKFTCMGHCLTRSMWYDLINNDSPINDITALTACVQNHPVLTITNEE